jgi:NAD+ kinase
VLTVEAGRGVRSVARESLTDALASVAAGEHDRWSIPTLSIAGGGQHLADAVMDAMLVTAEPAHISEFSVRTPADRVDQFRADGVHVATAAGTSGYARRVDAPVFDPETDAAAVVPVAPFSIYPDHWVVPLRAEGPVVEVTVDREEAAVTLLADDRTVGSVTPHEPITFTAGGSLQLVSVPESQSPFSGSDEDIR